MTIKEKYEKVCFSLNEKKNQLERLREDLFVLNPEIPELIEDIFILTEEKNKLEIQLEENNYD